MPVLSPRWRNVEPNRVYVMPPISSSPLPGAGCGPNSSVLADGEKPVDVFLGALARDLGELAVGVVLSGGDGDGTLGAKAIKEHGG